MEGRYVTVGGMRRFWGAINNLYLDLNNGDMGVYTCTNLSTVYLEFAHFTVDALRFEYIVVPL